MVPVHPELTDAPELLTERFDLVLCVLRIDQAFANTLEQFHAATIMSPPIRFRTPIGDDSVNRGDVEKVRLCVERDSSLGDEGVFANFEN
jgi:hypothetical protein